MVNAFKNVIKAISIMKEYVQSVPLNANHVLIFITTLAFLVQIVFFWIQAYV